MCGLVGLYKHNNDKVSVNELDSFTDSLAHRGPDGRGTFINEGKNLGLGHRRLSILDISKAGSQPMSYKNSRYQIVYNGEVYNFQEIRNELLKLDYKFESNTDTEIIVASYDAWGDKCQLKFNGMWAFAIWDSLKNQIFISRDRFGSKPLYYYKKDYCFAFASELKSFFYLNSKIKPEYHYKIISSIKVNNYETNETMLKNVNMIPPGHQILFDCKINSFSIKQWWNTEDHLVATPTSYVEQADKFKSIFIDACKIRMRSDVPVATSLSGGLDSSSVCSVVNFISVNINNSLERFSKHPYSTFIFDLTGHSEYKKLSERLYAEEVLKNINSKSYFIESDSYKEINPEDLVYKTEDVGDSLVGPYLIYKKMRETGYKISIDGHGADELLGGYNGYVDYALKDIEHGLSNDSYKNIYSIIKDNNREQIIPIKRKIRFLLGHQIYKIVMKVLNFFKITKNNTNQLFIKRFISNTKNKKFNNLDKALYQSFHGGELQYILNRFDKLSMASSVESRSPFLDWRLVTFGFSIPSTTKIGKGYTKLILRDSMKGLVPDLVRLRRDKFGFRLPKKFEKSFLKEYVFDNLNSLKSKNIDFFDSKKIIKKLESEYNYHNYRKAFRCVQMANLMKKFSSIE
jgi:asparagine synthase (glutamine-hydrolysing)